MYRMMLCAAAALLIAGITNLSAAADDDSRWCREGNTEAKIAACSRLIDRNPEDAEAYDHRGEAYSFSNTYDRAIADFDKAIGLDPKNAKTYTHRGKAYAGKKDFDRAIADFDQAIRLDPRDATAWSERGRAYESKGDNDRAIADYDQAIRLNPIDRYTYISRARVYSFSDAKGDHDRAIADYEHVIQLDPKNVSSYHSLGMAYYYWHDYDRAIAAYDRGARICQGGPGIETFTCSFLYNSRGDAYFAKGDYRRAFADYDQQIKLEPRASSYAVRGLAYGKNGDFDRAMADLNKAIAMDPAGWFVYEHRAEVYELRGDHDRAIADADEAISLAGKGLSSSARTYYVRGNAWFGKGVYDRAIADYDEALKLSPKYKEAQEGRDRARAALAALSPTEAPPKQPTQTADPQPGASVIPTGRRVALVIGNSHYRSVPTLADPQRDAQAVAEALRQDGFQIVELAIDLDREGMAKALRTFRDRADTADWALVYFAGHGIEINRVNYLIPVDAKLVDDRDVKDEAVSVESVRSAVNGARALRVIVLDACRVNPFKERMRRTIAARSPTDRGLAAPPKAEPGMLVVYSAKEGEVAEDDTDGINSPFARAFVAQLKVPGREVRRLFDYVRDDVLLTTGRRQQPFVYGSLPADQDFFFLAAK